MRVAVCGLGRMGAVFAAALVARGHRVTVWNRTPREVPGARTAGTAAEAAGGAAAVVVMVLDGPAARSVLLGPAGVTAGADRGALVVNATTLDPGTARALAERVTAAGQRYLEAPVLGSVPAARQGTLRVLAGGAAEDVRTAEPLLRAWSHAGALRHVGAVGDASALKLVANLGLGVAATGLRDAVRLAADLGLAREDVLEVLASGPLGGLVGGKRDRLAQGAYAAADFTVAALAKDLALATGAAAGSLPVAEAAARVVGRAAERDGGLDIAALGAAPERAPRA
ncbi:NAD(P)-binding domain-containing protein [Streptomyces sp. DSM 44915]|uniref:NAD(P)-binding domain-containing protein n=1 Tax=Streptomyces chisholmiae TaxID=3075540 RepID=A0ABU2JP49_9ACTN|nr:NAD(P)-binding domain-containing protein [Streptomyces sp. DSM 44915]MDT0266762.1 NAD(P)-binding domain-containing protein [Streptomyces sp. DSM 44915]